MSRRKPTSVDGSAGGGAGMFYWPLILLLLGGIIWVIWKAGVPQKPQPAPAASGRTSAPPSVAVTPLPRPTNTARPSPAAIHPPRTVSNAPPRTAAVAPPTNPPPLLVAPPYSGTGVMVTPLPPLKTNRPAAGPADDVFPRPVRDMFEAQVALARQGISCGSIDGVAGTQTRRALRAFQRKHGLPETGAFDPETRVRLQLAAPPHTLYTVTSNDLARLRPLSGTWLGKSKQDRLDYETLLEYVAELSRSHPSLIRQLNPGIQWTMPPAGTAVKIPDTACPPTGVKAAFLQIRLSEKSLSAFDARTNLIAFFPCSIAKNAEKRPVGALHVTAVIPDPDYTFDPALFPESAESRTLNRKLVVPPGPNNPVGTAWIGLDKPGYGIHGTPAPEQVGRTESHGCFRLANWNAEQLVRLVSIGTPVHVEP